MASFSQPASGQTTLPANLAQKPWPCAVGQLATCLTFRSKHCIVDGDTSYCISSRVTNFCYPFTGRKKSPTDSWRIVQLKLWLTIFSYATKTP
jgi:hypothetical protein